MKYIVKEGDTLSQIAKQYNTTVGAIYKANKDKITNIHILMVGWELSIPSKNVDAKELLNKCLSDIENLDSFKALEEIL